MMVWRNCTIASSVFPRLAKTPPKLDHYNNIPKIVDFTINRQIVGRSESRTLMAQTPFGRIFPRHPMRVLIMKSSETSVADPKNIQRTADCNIAPLHGFKP